MTRILSGLVCAIAMLVLSVSVSAEEKATEMKLVGDIQCGKCALKESKACHAVITVEKEGKKTTYWFDDVASKKYHGDICQETKPGTVVGTVKKDGDKMVVTVKSLEYTK